MDFRDIRGFTVTNLSRINVLLGKNGCGKSYLLKELEQGVAGLPHVGKVRYISPERGGLLQYSPDIDNNIWRNPKYLLDQRRRNQSENFRQQSTSLFRRLELLVLREIERKTTDVGFDRTVDQLNILLDRVKVVRDMDRTFRIRDNETNEDISPDRLSSGESELISLGIEFLSFIKEAMPDRTNIIFVDEPDVHLHPDLQHRLSVFIISVLASVPVTLILATHSTAFLAGLSESPDIRVAFMRRKMTELHFKPVSEVDRAILPIFGAHPLSNIFNQAPILLVEGEDDERVWQQAVRSSQGKLRLHPCDVGGNGNFAEFEREVSRIMESVYDNAQAFSLRDRDCQIEPIHDEGHVVRMRLGCRAAENLMLSDDVLTMSGTDWAAMQRRISDWINRNGTHPRFKSMSEFAERGYDRKNHDLKAIRNILIGEISTKPWEVIVGQAIAELVHYPKPLVEGSLREFLGEKTCRSILKLD